MDKRRTADIRKEACGEMCRKERMAAENGDRTVIGQIHWKGRAYPVREIDVGSSTFRVSVESLRDELITDMRKPICAAVSTRRWRYARKSTVSVPGRNCAHCRMPSCIECIVERIMERNMKKRSNFTPMERFREILHGNGLQSMNVGTNHIRIPYPHIQGRQETF